MSPELQQLIQENQKLRELLELALDGLLQMGNSYEQTRIAELIESQLRK